MYADRTNYVCIVRTICIQKKKIRSDNQRTHVKQEIFSKFSRNFQSHQHGVTINVRTSTTVFHKFEYIFLPLTTTVA
ncbi:MAG: hypothetical protein ACI8RD_007517 [Bacillariaceae sp.]|jgi:hypothetical protein